MRILIVNYEFPPLGGGGGIACYQIARELAKKHQVDYLTTGFRGIPSQEIVDGINVYRIPVLGRKDLSTATLSSMLSFFPSSLYKGIRLCRRNGYDIINSHFVIPSGLTALFLSRIFKIPVVMSIHAGDLYDPTKRLSPHKHFSLRILIRFLLNHSDRIVAQSSNTKENAIRYYSPKKEIDIIPLGFTEPRFGKVSRRELGLSDKDIILISVGRVVKRKGYDYAIKAVSKLQYENIKYIIIGSGPEEENLKALARELKIQDKVKFLGFIPEEKKFQYLWNSDIYVLSSLHEGFGICLLEAMYCGLSIVSTDNGGQTDFLIDGENALLVPIKDSLALKKAIQELIEGKEMKGKMSQNNKRDIKKFYIQNIAKEYEELFKNLE